MNWRQLEALQDAVPILLRHLTAYVELAGQDMSTDKEQIASRLRLGALLIGSAFFAVAMTCAFIVAATWDTNNRLWAIGVMVGVFIVLTVSAAIALTRKKSNPFASVRREWQQDRLVLERLLSHAQGDERSNAHVG